LSGVRNRRFLGPTRMSTSSNATAFAPPRGDIPCTRDDSVPMLSDILIAERIHSLTSATFAPARATER
jgi:hypothetical protein